MDYDTMGHATHQVDPLGRQSTATYDPLGRLQTQTDALGQQTQYLYDLAGRVTTMIDAAVGRPAAATMAPATWPGAPIHWAIPPAMAMMMPPSGKRDRSAPRHHQ